MKKTFIVYSKKEYIKLLHLKFRNELYILNYS